MPKVVFKDVSVTYCNNKNKSKVVALNNLNLELESGKTHVILGFSGCGKSTLLKTLFDSAAYTGLITFDGVDIENSTVPERNLGYVSQTYALYPNMTIFNNIAFPLKNLGADSEEIKKRVFEIAEEFDISMCLTRKPRHISGGQQQRVVLARALIKNPSLCILDEPLSNLDQEAAFKAKRFIYDSLKRRNITTIYVTHNVNEATSLGDYIHLMKDGVIVYSGTPIDFINSDNLDVKDYLNKK